MATVDECRAALGKLGARLDANAAQRSETIDLDRPLACTVRDLGVAFHGRLSNGRLIGMTDGDDPNAKLRITANSDDLVALVDGNLDITKAWASGKVKIDGNMFDLLKLRKLL
jgi:predicted lipid carrier protein YhbT